MRHTFLPPAEQKILKQNYRMHVAIVALFLLSVAGMIGIGSLFPAYARVYTEERTQLATVASIRKNKDTSGLAPIEAELRADASKIAALSDVTTIFRPSALMGQVVAARGAVRLTSIVIDDTAAGTPIVTVQGVAPTRESLVQFKTRLETTMPGASADLPISELAKSKDIVFSLKITISKP